ncbi:protein ALP1-like [Sitophilus oryzae]|uniref:Protein ALP1-like n=1 Tax=Sitophilus oryzae TaxID=7048 RepID=A0A6J2XQ26_SITOR|nr:protein ALP1-like [Sitophilus oryzae]
MNSKKVQLLKTKRIKNASTVLLEMLTEELGNMLEENILTLEDPHEYRLALRINTENFDKLLKLIECSIQCQDTIMREALPGKIKLVVTLTYLATGMSYRSLSHLYRVSKPSISLFIPEVCRAIYAALKQYIKFPETKEGWKIIIENGFRTKWNFPLCYGSIDGKHVEIKAPWKSGSQFFNYKKNKYSIVFLAVADHNYCFTYIDVGASGSASDGGVFKNCSLHQYLENGFLPENGVMVGDAAFPLKKYLIKPYPGVNLSAEQKIFNYRLSRARRIVENAFGILVSRFRIFEKPISTNLSTVDAIRRSRRDEITPLQSIANQGSNHSAEAREKRDLYKKI